MPCQDYHTIPELEPYLELSKTVVDALPVGRYRIFVGWGAEWERKYLRDCKISPSALPNLIARVDGQTLFGYAFTSEQKSSKFAVSYI